MVGVTQNFVIHSFVLKTQSAKKYVYGEFSDLLSGDGTSLCLFRSPQCERFKVYIGPKVRF